MQITWLSADRGFDRAAADTSAKECRKQDNGTNTTDDVSNGGCPNNAVSFVNKAENKHQRNIKDTLAQKGKNQRFPAVAGCLKERNNSIGAGGERCAQT